MNDRFRLVALGNEELLAGLKGLVRREHVAMADMLAHLAELDERRLYLDLGYSSLFTYCREALGFCKSSAGRRIAAARVCRNYPDAFLRLAKGELQLSVLSVLGSYLNATNALELFAACSGKSFEQVEELLAARFPRPDVRDLIRRLPEASRRAPDIGSAKPRMIPEQAANVPAEWANTGQQVEDGPQPVPAADDVQPLQPADEAQRSQASAITISADEWQIQHNTRLLLPARDRVEALAPGRFGVHFTADAEFRELLAEVRALASHQQPRGELLPLMKRALEAYRRELQKRRFALGTKPRSEVASVPSSVPAPGSKRTRRVSAALRRAVYARDSGCCTFIAADGRRCGASRFLELDHIAPWASGGESTFDNLRLRCRAHNQHSARAHFGGAHMRAAVARARSRLRQQSDADREAEIMDSRSAGPRRTVSCRVAFGLTSDRD